MPKLIVDEIGAYMVAGQLRDPQGAMMVKHSAPQSGVIEVTLDDLEALMLKKIINILNSIKQLKQNGLDFTDEILDANLRRAIRLATSSAASKIYLQDSFNDSNSIKQDEIFTQLSALSVLTDELPFRLKSGAILPSYSQIDWHKLKELQEILIQNGVKDGNYQRSKMLLKSFFSDLTIDDIEKMIHIFNCVGNHREFDHSALEGFNKIIVLVGYYEDRNFIADKGFRPNQILTSKIDLMARADIEDRCCTTIAGRLAILRFLAFIGENHKKFTNGEIRAMLPENLYQIRNCLLDHITLEKMQKSLIPLLRNPEYEDIFRNLFRLCNTIAHTLKEIDQAEELELVDLDESSEDIWQRIKTRQLKTALSLNSQAIDDLIEAERSIRYRPLMNQQRFLDFKVRLITDLGLNTENRIYSKNEEKKRKKGQDLNLKTFDQMLDEWQNQYNKGEDLFGEGAIESLWQICKKFQYQNITNEQDLRLHIGNLLSNLKSELAPLQPTPLEAMFASLQFVFDSFGNDCRLRELGADLTLHQIIIAELTSYQPTESVTLKQQNRMRNNYRQGYGAVTERIEELAQSFISNPEKLHAAELMIGMIDDLSSEAQSSKDFKRFYDLGYRISGSKTVRNRIDHQQSTYREHDVESEDSFSTVYINNNPKSTAQTLLFMMINLRGVVNEMLYNPQIRQTQLHQFAT